jgi:hypothetical protein
MDTRPLVLIADKGLNNQALLGDLLAAEAQIGSIVRESQLEFSQPTNHLKEPDCLTLYLQLIPMA